jgi:hypothetical protein
MKRKPEKRRNVYIKSKWKDWSRSGGKKRRNKRSVAS